MLAIFPRLRGRAAAGLAALLGAACFAVPAHAADKAAAPPPLEALKADPLPMPPADPAPSAAPIGVEAPAAVPADGAAPAAAPGAAGSPAGTEPPKSIWAKVPPPTTYPRLGAFFFPPTGPGYYSLKDVCQDNYREKPPVNPYPPFGLDPFPFYDNNFRYLDDPKNTQCDCFDPIKRIHVGDDWLLSFGGEERARYANEVDSRLSGRSNSYWLERSRLYGDLWYRDLFRIYVEGVDAERSDGNLPPAPTDVNKTDLINLFIDLKLAELDCHPVYTRVGRQELDYGSQRLISQTDFPNAPRSFDAAKVFWHGDKVWVDGFVSRPLVIDRDRFDSENDKAVFTGLWTTLFPAKTESIDLYYLYLDNATPIPGVARGGRGGFDVNTFGARFAGDRCHLVWDFEGMYQFGERGAQTSSAGAGTGGLGLHFAEWRMNPFFWIYYDYASGNHNPGRGEYGTFNQLFPNGHNYFGWTDLVGRQNIHDLNFQTWFYPAKWITVGGQYHILDLDSARDALFNSAGAVERVDPTGRSGLRVGQVLTGIVNFHLSQHSDVFVQYSHLYAGDFLENTGSGKSPDQVFLQYTFRY